MTKCLEFECPQCGGTKLDEVTTGVVEYSEIEVYPNGRMKYVDVEDVHEKTSTHYACLRCTYPLEGVCDMTSLVEWINFNCTFSIKAIRKKLGVTEQQAHNIRAIVLDLESLEHEGNHISTAERHAVDAGANLFALEDDEPVFVMNAVTNVISWRDDWPTILPEVWVAAHTFTSYFLAYSFVHKHYFWATTQDLHEMEEQWKKKNS